MKYVTIYFLWIFIISVGNAQIYMLDGRQISGTDSIAFGNANAAQINPSGLGQVKSSNFSIQLLQLGFDIYSEALTRSLSGQFVFSKDPINSKDKIDFLEILNDQPFDISTRIDLNWLSLYFGTPDLGGFSLGISDNIYGKGLLTGNQFAFLINGREELGDYSDWSRIHYPTTWNGSFLSFMHLRTIDIGYGRKLFTAGNASLYAGIKYSRIFGIGLLDHTIEDGMFLGSSSFSSFYDITFDDLREPESLLKQKLLSNSGLGQNISAGLSLGIGSEFNFGIAIMDWGHIEWVRNVYKSIGDNLDLSDQDLQSGVNKFQLGEELDFLFKAFRYQPDPETIEYDTRARIRVNGYYKPSSNISFSVDFLSDLKSSEFYDNETSFVLGFDWQVLPRFSFLRVHSGLLYHSIYGLRCPLGASFQIGEKFKLISISTNDIISLFINGINPLTSFTISTVNLGW